MGSLYAKSNKLLRTFSDCSIDVKVTIFQSYCPVLCCPFLWSKYEKSTFEKIRDACSNAYRKSGFSNRSSASAMYANYNICSFDTMLRKNIFGFKERLLEI